MPSTDRSKDTSVALREALNVSSFLSRKPIIIVVTSPKGGAGKGTISQAIGAAAATEGRRVVILDYDTQKSSFDWCDRRSSYDGADPITGVRGTWISEQLFSTHEERDIYERNSTKDEIAAQLAKCDVLIIDTPTAVEEHMPRIDAMVRAADYVLIPTGSHFEDWKSTRPWMTTVRGLNPQAAFVLNRVNKQTTSVRKAKMALLEVGKLCPIDIPAYEDIGNHPELGLSVAEVQDAKGHGELRAVWSFVKSELGVQ
jgi:chromosome partitioning protein